MMYRYFVAFVVESAKGKCIFCGHREVDTFNEVVTLSKPIVGIEDLHELTEFLREQVSKSTLWDVETEVLTDDDYLTVTNIVLLDSREDSNP
jgi:hypothetical protein